MTSLTRVERRLSGGALGASRRVTLNVGGTLFMTTTETLCQEPSCAFFHTRFTIVLFQTDDMVFLVHVELFLHFEMFLVSSQVLVGFIFRAFCCRTRRIRYIVKIRLFATFPFLTHLFSVLLLHQLLCVCVRAVCYLNLRWGLPGHYFIDRSPTWFPLILNYLRTRTLAEDVTALSVTDRRLLRMELGMLLVYFFILCVMFTFE